MCKLLPSISQTLLDGLNRKAARGDSVAPLWSHLVRQELNRCAEHLDSLSVSERASACDLLDWYVSYCGDDAADDSWFSLYRTDELELRTTASLLNWYCWHLDNLSHFERKVLIDMADNYLAVTGKFSDAWKAIYIF